MKRNVYSSAKINLFFDRAARASIRNVKGPAPRGPPKPRTAPKPPPAVARGKAIYAYEAQDVDELTIKVGEVIEIITEGLFNR